MTDDGGVFENLPRSRPGKRSEKRASAAPGAAPKRPRPAAKGPSGQTRPHSEERPREPVARRTADPVGHVVRGAAKAAETGVRVAGTVAQELLRRVPRP
jgi:hypothetical protein